MLQENQNVFMSSEERSNIQALSRPSFGLRGQLGSKSLTDIYLLHVALQKNSWFNSLTGCQLGAADKTFSSEVMMLVKHVCRWSQKATDIIWKYYQKHKKMSHWFCFYSLWPSKPAAEEEFITYTDRIKTESTRSHVQIITLFSQTIWNCNKPPNSVTHYHLQSYTVKN